MVEDFKPPAYEEYQKATEFARIRYKYGLWITILCWVCLIFLIVYLFINVEETKSNPIQYGIRKMNLDHCSCYDETKTINLFFNSTSMKQIEQFQFFNP